MISGNAIFFKGVIGTNLIFMFVPCTIQVGSDSMQGAGAPTMFQAMRRIVDSLMHQSMGEGALERAIHSSFLGKT